MSTQYTVDDSSSFQCFCGSRHCCCQFLNRHLKLRLPQSSFHIIQQIQKQQQKELLKQLLLRETMEKRKNRKGIFGKKGSIESEIQGRGERSSRERSWEGKKVEEVEGRGSMPMFETKQTLRRNSWREGRETRRIFGSGSRGRGGEGEGNMDGDTTILFNPYEFQRYESSMELENINGGEIKGNYMRNLNESKEGLLEEFLESTLFKNISQKQTSTSFKQPTSINLIHNNNDLLVQQLLPPPPSPFSSPLPEILHDYSTLISSSLNILNPSISLPTIQQQKLKLYSSLSSAHSLCHKFLIAIQQIQKHSLSKQDLLSNFTVQNFNKGEWLPNWDRLRILLPKYEFLPENKSVEEYQRVIVYEIQPLLSELREQLNTTYFLPQLYIEVREHLVEILEKFKRVCENLYYLVRNSRVSGDYQVAYRYMNESAAGMLGEEGVKGNRERVKEMVRERELYVVKLKYLKDVHDIMWSGGVGEMVMEKVKKDVERLKREWYRRKE